MRCDPLEKLGTDDKRRYASRGLLTASKAALAGDSPSYLPDDHKNRADASSDHSRVAPTALLECRPPRVVKKTS